MFQGRAVKTLGFFAAGAVAAYFAVNLLFRVPYETRPDRKIAYGETSVYDSLLRNAEVRWEELYGTLEFISNEYDCSDFRLVNLIRILYEYGDRIPSDVFSDIREVLLDFRFWWSDRGGNSMCYWSENHQILFASAEYLVGQYFPDEYFRKSGLSGMQMKFRAEKRINEWCAQRWKYGFSEYYSNVYYLEDIAALVNLIDFADEEISRRASIVLDVLFYDLAAQNFHGNFVSTSSRAYEANRKYSEMDGLYRYFTGVQDCFSGNVPGMLMGLSVTGKYRLPPVIGSIARDTSEAVILQSNGLDLSELEGEGLLGQEDGQLMMQWGMESFVNPETVSNSIMAFRSRNMFRNEFVTAMKWLDIPLLSGTSFLGKLVSELKPVQSGTVLQKGNTYTFRTAFYSIYTTQRHFPGEPADQHHVFGFNMPGGISVFHTHPARSPGSRQHSPNFWVGYGRFPDSVQDRNINLSIYRIPDEKLLMEKEILDYTYLFVPEDKLDTLVLSGDRHIFGKKGDSYFSVAGTSQIVRNEAGIFVQRSDAMAWITELGSAVHDGSFEEFTDRILSNRISFDPACGNLEYISNGKTYELQYMGGFRIGGEKVNTDYKGLSSPYADISRAEEERVFVCGTDTLVLNFNKNTRCFN